MLGKPISARRRVISAFDPALHQISSDKRIAYLDGRDIDKLGDLSVLPSQPTIFHVDPVKREHKHLLDGDKWHTRAALFSICVQEIENPPGPVKWEDSDGLRRLTDESLDVIGTEVVDELVGVIRGFARSDTTPFSLPDGYSDFERDSLRRRALNAIGAEVAASNISSPTARPTPPDESGTR